MTKSIVYLNILKIFDKMPKIEEKEGYFSKTKAF